MGTRHTATEKMAWMEVNVKKLKDRDVLIKLREVLEYDSAHRFYIRHIDCTDFENYTVSYYGEAKLVR